MEANDHPLLALQSQCVGEYRIEIKLKPFRSRQGWTQFSLYLRDLEQRISSQKGPTGTYLITPVLEGIHSRGGRGVVGWMELGDYFPLCHFYGDGQSLTSVNLSETQLDLPLFGFLSGRVPPGGHRMFAYEVSWESPFHRATQESLRRGIPPVCTEQGTLLFSSGFRWIKDWYLAEGGHEGPRKLWGEKPLDEVESLRFDLKTFLQLLAYLSRKPISGFMEQERAARKRGLKVMGELRLERRLSDLGEEIKNLYQKDAEAMLLDKPAYHCCNLVGSIDPPLFANNEFVEELRRIARACSFDFTRNSMSLP